jgi:general secretion pathway protein A
MSSSVFPGLREAPFNVTPDQRFLYLNDCYRDALAALTDGIETRQGIVALIGEAGTGKTMLLRRLLDTLQPSVNAVLLLYPTVGFEEILEHVLIALGIPAEGTQLARLRRLNEFLLEHTTAGGNVAVLIDEAQDLEAGVLAKLPLLSNLETAGKSRLQILLVGQPELNVKLAELEALEKRVVRRVSLGPLAATEVGRYVRSRLERAGAVDLSLFTDDALERIAFLSEGIPGLVNAICDAAMVRALAAGATEVTPEIVDRAWSYSAASGLPSRAESAAEPAAAAMVPAPESVPAVVSEPTTETPPELETTSVIETEAAMETAPPVETPRAPETAPANDPAPVTIAPAKPSVSRRVWSVGVAGALAIISAAGLYGLSLRSGSEHALQAVSSIATGPAPPAPSVTEHPATAEVAGTEEPVPAGSTPSSPNAAAMASANGQPPEPDTGHNDHTTSDSVKVENASAPQQGAVEADKNIVAAPPVPATVRAAPPRPATKQPLRR